MPFETNYAQRLHQAIEERSARIAVMGLGYVGLPLALAFAEAGFYVDGVDPDIAKCEALARGESYVGDVPSAQVAGMVDAGRLKAHPTPEVLAQADAVIICVPTPLSKSKDPDISYIVQAAENLGQFMHPGMLVVLESTTYPGTTEEIILPRVRRNGFEAGREIFVAFSPERVDPGNRVYTIRNTPKVVGGVTPTCLQLATALYATIVERIVPVSSPATAEMVKILENTYRAVNIGLINEMAQICHRIGIDIWEVIAAASTKPFGFAPFYPGPGLGGHCIPIDPLYLTWKMRSLSVQTRFIELADAINTAMPAYVVQRVQDALNEESKPLRGSRILILGVTYKADVADLRESPALTIVDLLASRGAIVQFHDPFIERIQTGTLVLERSPLTMEALREADCVLIHTAHSSYDWEKIVAHARMIFDTRNVTSQFRGKAYGRIHRL